MTKEVAGGGDRAGGASLDLSDDQLSELVLCIEYAIACARLAKDVGLVVRFHRLLKVVRAAE